ncbi:DUF3325 domain-containing protein [Niveispirillum fermenti]|uniref:DUF3325 domain-containing protein n=1 Tax=Niveispirillum fermenti TaxID=1233113 RepID=UPI003A87BCF9
MSLLSWLLALAGFAALALAMPDHHHWLRGRDPTPSARRRLQLAGTLLLVGSWIAAAVAWGAATGSVAWCGLLTVSAAPLVLARTYLTPRRR